jgi:hypothetical protein
MVYLRPCLNNNISTYYAKLYQQIENTGSLKLRPKIDLPWHKIMGYLGGTFTVTAGSTSAFFNGNSLRSGSGGKVTLAGTTLRTVCNMVLKLRGLLMSGSVATAMSIRCVCVLSLRENVIVMSLVYYRYCQKLALVQHYTVDGLADQ